jgi:hypothetical protein
MDGNSGQHKRVSFPWMLGNFSVHTRDSPGFLKQSLSPFLKIFLLVFWINLYLEQILTSVGCIKTKYTENQADLGIPQGRPSPPPPSPPKASPAGSILFFFVTRKINRKKRSVNKRESMKRKILL